MQEHRKFAGYRHHGSLLGVLPATLGDLQAVAPDVRILPEGSQDVLSTVDLLT